jgi:nucleotide-binding universal stress UspA family protein
MKDSEVDKLSTRDPVVNAFHTFGQLNNVAVSGEVQLVPEGSYSEVLGERASDYKSDMILVPWSETGSFSEAVTANMNESTQSAFSNGSYNYFVTKLLNNTPCNAAILVNNSFGALPRETLRSLHRVSTNPSIRGAPVHATAPLMDRSHHIFFPFIGGMDNRIALHFVLRLVKNPNVTATIVCIKGAETISPSNTVISSDKIIAKDGQTAGITSSQEILSSQDQAFFASMADSLSSDLQSRILFNSIESNHSLQDIVEQAREEVNLSQENAGDLIVVGRHHGKHTDIAFDYGTEGELRHSLGGFAEAMIMGNVKASVLVIQAAVKVE